MKNANIAPIRIPVKTVGSEAGSRTFLKTSNFPSPAVLATLTSTGSTFLIPVTVLNSTGHWETQKMIAIFETSPIPKNTMKTGRSVNGLAWPRICKSGLMAFSTFLKNPPSMNPKGRATQSANPNPANTLDKLTSVSVVSVPLESVATWSKQW